MQGAVPGGGAQPDRRSGEHRTDLLTGGAQPDRRSGEHRTDVLTLASRSPQRRKILEQLGVSFDVRPADVEELASGEPRGLVVENALRKARAVPCALVLGVDTAVALDGRILGQPAGRDQARAHLRALSGHTHEVWSGVAIIEGGAERTAAAVTRVTFRTLSDPDVEAYLDTGEWEGRAGAYAIQERGAGLVAAIDGECSNVVGLPIATLRRLAPQLVGS